MPASLSRSGTATSSIPSPFGMNANTWPACHRRAVRLALGIEIWNFDDSVAVSLADMMTTRSIDWR